MPKERESELRHLGGKAFQPMHSSCMKKMPTNRLKEAPGFDALSVLKDLSVKADQLAEKKLPENYGLEEWFAACRKTIDNIRDCKSVKDIQYPPSIETFFIVENKDEKLVSSTVEATPKLEMTASVMKITPDVCVSSNTQMETPSTSVRKKVNPFVLLNQLTTEEIILHSNENSLKNNNKSLMQTPVLNRTYEKINETAVTDSGSVRDKNRTTKAANSSNSSGIITRSGKKKENECSNSHGMSTRSGSKRKSSDSKNKSCKKQKVDSHNTSSATLNKTAQLRRPLRHLNVSVLASENRSKSSSVIKPPVLPKQNVVSKEKHILEEMKKKEKKREENLQKIMAERQQKAELNKKTREEKRTKTLQKRLQLEKEKEEKREKEAKKSQVTQAKANKENPKKTTRTKELVEQHIKESKSSIITSTIQNTSSAEAVVKTPPAASRKSDDIQSYELTPVPDSSTYNFSDDDEDERPARKPIPAWAQGVLLKSALMQQYYYPVNTDDIFGNVIETPNLAEIFKVNKKRYLKRTSSAVWTSSPDRIFHL